MKPNIYTLEKPPLISNEFAFDIVVVLRGVVVVRPKFGKFLYIFFLPTQELNYIWEVPKKFHRIESFGRYHYNNNVILQPAKGQVVLFDPERRRISGHLNFVYDDCNTVSVSLAICIEGRLA